MISFVAGDLLSSREEDIAQGVAEGNQEGLGTGLAFKISKRWPEVQAAFKRHARSGQFTGGSLWTLAPTESHPGFVYLATQPDMFHATLPYLRKAVRNLAKWSEKHVVHSVGMPKIGAGLGKLSWHGDVRPLLVEYHEPEKTHFVVYENFRNEFEGPNQ